MYIELDGHIGHFGVGWNGKPDEDAPRRDLMKETWALEHGRRVIRLLQRDVWVANYDWGIFLTEAIRLTLDASTSFVLCQNVPEYEGGVYASLRNVWSCREMSLVEPFQILVYHPCENFDIEICDPV